MMPIAMPRIVLLVACGVAAASCFSPVQSAAPRGRIAPAIRRPALVMPALAMKGGKQPSVRDATKLLKQQIAEDTLECSQG